ncbi:hypothetical protein GH714_028310 [Hevea brasiliensis]|uniref:RING-type domain-containing protein n=1 Tax=Hevea brasiliensis TaxID=3981 RepID=A0A6A6KW74_HEVBR|nr:hypothetical protein GH714_028310 [Hevea brasiliensis]
MVQYESHYDLSSVSSDDETSDNEETWHNLQNMINGDLFSANSEDIFRNSSSSSSSSSGSSGGGGSRNGNSRRYGINISASNLIHAPLTTLLEYSGILRGGGNASSAVQEREQLILPPPSSAATQSSTGAHHQEVTIRIVGAADSNVASTVEAMPASSDDQPGFCVAMWIAAVLFKSNDILKKQTALKGDRKNSIIVTITLGFMLHVMSIYWWYRNDDLLSIGLTSSEHNTSFLACFIYHRDAMVRQVAMAFKCVLLMHYKNSRGHNYRKQGQMLTLVEYFLLLYRSLLPAPVWYRFFLNKEYGSFFSSNYRIVLNFQAYIGLGKGSIVLYCIEALSCKEMNHVSYATSEQVNAAGDLCAICQEKMHAPILLRCKHIFCEECVSEWFERERTCPLCRALVKPADIRSYSDGSTSLFFQLF